MLSRQKNSTYSSATKQNNISSNFFGIKLQKTSTQVSPFAANYFIHNAFIKAGISQLIDNELGSRVKTVGYSYSDILKNLLSVFYCGGNCAEDIQIHLGQHLKSIPGNKVPSADTVLRGIIELAIPNQT